MLLLLPRSETVKSRRLAEVYLTGRIVSERITIVITACVVVSCVGERIV